MTTSPQPQPELAIAAEHIERWLEELADTAIAASIESLLLAPEVEACDESTQRIIASEGRAFFHFGYVTALLDAAQHFRLHT